MVSRIRKPSRRVELGALVKFGLLVGLVGYTLAGQVQRRLDRSRDSFALQRMAIGDRVSAEVVLPGNAISHALSDVEAGYCRYVVLASASCPVCRDDAKAWARETTKPHRIPEGWKVFWVVIGDAGSADSLFSSTGAISHYLSHDPLAFLASVGLTAFPTTLVLDRKGRLADASIGGRFPIAGAFSDDCHVSDPQEPHFD